MTVSGVSSTKITCIVPDLACSEYCECFQYSIQGDSAFYIRLVFDTFISSLRF
jgi:hypothetical protein